MPFVEVPLLATLLVLVMRGNVLDQRWSQGLLALASIGILWVGIVCGRLFVPMDF